MQFTTLSVALSLALAASATPLKRQTPDRFALFFAATDSDSEAPLLVMDNCGQNDPKPQCIVSHPSEPTSPGEPLIVDENFIFTSVNASVTGGQALIVDTFNSQSLSLTVPHSGFNIPPGFSHAGFSVIDGLLAINGSTSNFFGCLEWVPPGGQFPLYANDPIDLQELNEAPCFQRNIVVKTIAAAK
jgi:hypothetical protein